MRYGNDISIGGQNTTVSVDPLMCFSTVHHPSSFPPFLIVDVLSAALDTGTAVGILLVFFM